MAYEGRRMRMHHEANQLIGFEVCAEVSMFKVCAEDMKNL